MKLGLRSRSGQAPITAIVVLMTADAAFGFQQTAVVPTIPIIEQVLDASHTWSAWLLSGYLVASAVATPLIGKMADRHGKRQLLGLSLLIFLAGSVGAALAPSMAALVACRALQGIGGAVFPLSFAIAREVFPVKQLSLGISLLTSAFAAGMAFGFGMSGWIVSALSWRWIFASGAVVVAMSIVLVGLFIPHSREHTRSGLDLAGAALLAGGLSCLLIGLTEGEHLGWLSLPILGAFVLGLALLLGWIAWDLHVDEPLLDLRVLARPVVLYTNIASILAGYAMFSVFFLVPFLVRGGENVSYGFDVSPLVIGLYLMPASIGQGLTSLFATRLLRHFNPAWPFAGGLLLCGVGAVSLALQHGNTWQIVVPTFVLGMGFGLAVQVGTALITRSVAPTETAVATSLNSVMRRMGGSFGSQIAVALTAAITVSSGQPAERAFVIAFFSGGVAAVIGALFAVAIRRQRLAET